MSSISLNPWSKRGRTDDSVGATYNTIVDKILPDVMRRPACISDAWFVLNLIPNVPFIASLTYLNTMEVLEVASIEIFSAVEIVDSARKRLDILCIVWEGTCTEHGWEQQSDDAAT